MMRGRVWLPLIVLTASLLAQVAAATDFQNERFNLTPFVGWTFFDKELKEAPPKLHLDNDLYWGGRLGVRLISPLWLDLAGGYAQTTGYDVNTGCPCEATWTHLSANLMLQSAKPRAVQPFVSLGGGISKFVPRWSADDTDGTFEAAAGVKVKISNSVGLRLEARNVMLVPAKDYSKAHINNVVAGAGLVFAFGGKEDDADADGVPDKRDNCPDTPHGCTVDANGCPIDSDGDGVCDGLDQCADTPRGATVDTKGCPTDSDGDGVLDGIDQCADTPKGCTVDARGCPVDTDGDGVCDGLDKCAGTPIGTKVGSDGCPTEVRPEVRQRETELLDTGLIRLHDIKFDTDKTTILPESRPPLEVVGEVLSKWPQLNIEIGGYCDSRGTAEYNLALSGRRVTSVRRYLLEHFPRLEAAQIVAKGYGESAPLVPNTSPENMAQNRRVEFKVMNKEILKQLKR